MLVLVAMIAAQQGETWPVSWRWGERSVGSLFSKYQKVEPTLTSG
jgi:hypothetical protein